MMGLRLRDGLSHTDLQRAAGSNWDEAVNPATLAMLVESGLLVRDATGVRATEQGRQVLNGVLDRLTD